MRIGSGEYLVIVIAKGHVFPFCLFQPRIARRTDALIALMQHRNAGILCGDLLSNHGAAIGGTVIHKK